MTLRELLLWCVAPPCLILTGGVLACYRVLRAIHRDCEWIPRRKPPRKRTL